MVRRTKKKNMNQALIRALASAAIPAVRGIVAQPKRRRRKNKNKKNKNQLMNRNTLPAAVVRANRSFIRSWTEGNDMHVAGCDLVRKIGSTIVNANGIDELFSVIPCNPCYWGGTRIAQLAPGYQQYRPLEFSYEYVPQVAVTQEGTVTIGTLWCTSVDSEDLQQTLVTSNGGTVTQCYNNVASSVRLGSNLQYNLYNTQGWLGPDTNPFTLVAGQQGAGVVPGYFMITYHYVFKNPIGQAWDYNALWDADLTRVPESQYVSAVTLNQTVSYGPGTVLQYKDGAWTRQGNPLPVTNDVVRAAIFTCSQGESPAEPDPSPPPDPEPRDYPTASFSIKSLAITYGKGLLKDAEFLKTVPVTQPAWIEGDASLSNGYVQLQARLNATLEEGAPLLLVLSYGSIESSFTAIYNVTPVYPSRIQTVVLSKMKMTNTVFQLPAPPDFQATNAKCYYQLIKGVTYGRANVSAISYRVELATRTGGDVNVVKDTGSMSVSTGGNGKWPGAIVGTLIKSVPGLVAGQPYGPNVPTAQAVLVAGQQGVTSTTTGTATTIVIPADVGQEIAHQYFGTDSLNLYQFYLTILGPKSAADSSSLANAVDSNADGLLELPLT